MRQFVFISGRETIRSKHLSKFIAKMEEAGYKCPLIITKKHVKRYPSSEKWLVGCPQFIGALGPIQVIKHHRNEVQYITESVYKSMARYM